MAFVAELMQIKEKYLNIKARLFALLAAFLLTVNSGLQKGMNGSRVAESLAELLKLSNPVNPSEHSQIL